MPAISPEPEASTASDGEVERVVVGVDGSAPSRAALRVAADLAGGVGAPLAVVMTWEYPATAIVPGAPGPLTAPEAIDARMADTLRAVVAEELGPAAPARLDQVVARGHPSRILAARAADRPGTVIVVGSRGLGGLDEVLLGSTSRAVLHDARRVVIVVHGDPPRLGAPRAGIVVGVDGTPGGASALRWAGTLAAHLHTELTLVHGLGPTRATSPAAQAFRTQADDDLHGPWTEPLAGLGVAYRTVLTDTDPRTALAAEAEALDAGLVVVGRPRVRRGAHWPAGSVADFLARHAPRPVAVVPGPGAPDGR